MDLSRYFQYRFSHGAISILRSEAVFFFIHDFDEIFVHRLCIFNLENLGSWNAQEACSSVAQDLKWYFLLRYEADKFIWFNLSEPGPLSQSGETSYRQISWSLQAAKLGVITIVSLWNLTAISAAPRCLSNLRPIGTVGTRISPIRDFTRSCGKTSARLANRGTGISRSVSQLLCKYIISNQILQLNPFPWV